MHALHTAVSQLVKDTPPSPSDPEDAAPGTPQESPDPAGMSPAVVNGLTHHQFGGGFFSAFWGRTVVGILSH